jgi:hypothetical protein
MLQSHQLYPPHLRQLVEDTMQAFDDALLLPPENRKAFDSGKTYLARLQGFALSRGFVVITVSSKQGGPIWLYPPRARY